MVGVEVVDLREDPAQLHLEGLLRDLGLQHVRGQLHRLSAKRGEQVRARDGDPHLGHNQSVRLSPRIESEVQILESHRAEKLFCERREFPQLHGDHRRGAAVELLGGGLVDPQQDPRRGEQPDFGVGPRARQEVRRVAEDERGLLPDAVCVQEPRQSRPLGGVELVEGLPNLLFPRAAAGVGQARQADHGPRLRILQLEPEVARLCAPLQQAVVDLVDVAAVGQQADGLETVVEGLELVLGHVDRAFEAVPAQGACHLGEARHQEDV
mmetsp:Transcript_31008/g.78438  ORF Transcript_31008/g.78438 Transcript_31008/m.78438 type:complete len:267 (+) Transcript_31008:1397-2197(+)